MSNNHNETPKEGILVMVKELKKLVRELQAATKLVSTAADLIEESANKLPDACECSMSDAAPKAVTSDESPSPVAQDKPVIKFTDLRAVLADLARDGYKDDVRNLLARFGAEKLSELKPELYGEVFSIATATKPPCEE